MSGGSSGPSLLEMVGQWLIKDFTQRQIDEMVKISLQQIELEIPKRLKALEFVTMGLQNHGDIAYAQITVRRTTTGNADVFDLNRSRSAAGIGK